VFRTVGGQPALWESVLPEEVSGCRSRRAARSHSGCPADALKPKRNVKPSDQAALFVFVSMPEKIYRPARTTTSAANCSPPGCGRLGQLWLGQGPQ